ncbi:MAG: DUF1858 domain-containing protein [Nanoarchaeota archaeon]|nr:DUF1858 domain-containing protein [Nanoarchaeota archaeon]
MSAKPIITKEMGIGEIVDKHPEAVDILLSEGIHCIGCLASHFESLEEGLTAHGKSEEEIKKLVKKMNEHLKK